MPLPQPALLCAPGVAHIRRHRPFPAIAGISGPGLTRASPRPTIVTLFNYQSIGSNWQRKMTAFVHLRVHSEYSISDGMLRAEKLPAQAAALGMPAVALTDRCNLFALIKFYRAALAAGVKPIMGCDMLLAMPGDVPPALLTLLVRNQEGYRNLVALVSRAWQERARLSDEPLLDRRWLADGNANGLIALSGGQSGDIGRALLSGDQGAAEQLLDGWQALFPDAFYLDVQRVGRARDEEYLHAAAELAAARNCPVVATNDVCFAEQKHFESHELRVCIGEGTHIAMPNRQRRYGEEQYLRPPQEMSEVFQDLPEALENSVEIARRCNLMLTLGEVHLPRYPEVPEGQDDDSYLADCAAKGLRERLAAGARAAAEPAAYESRLHSELEVIASTGFAGYFLIVMDFVRWAKEQGIPVGPGRGSGAGSLVAWALGITELDPLAYGLLFERFLNPERVSPPDFDIDFCQDRRDEIIRYAGERYGAEAVAHIVTFNRMAARAVVRDVNRAQHKPFPLGDRIARLIPFAIDMTLARARAEKSEIHDMLASDSEAREVWDASVPLEGLVRNASKHAGGLVIAPGKVTNFAPLYFDTLGTAGATQFDKDDVEQVGLVKFDFLGLTALTVIANAAAMVNERCKSGGSPPIAIAQLPLDDKKTYRLLQEGRTIGVFQLESAGMRDLMRRLRPDRFDDIIALVALYRPGPLEGGMVDEYIRCRHAPDAVRYLHPSLEPHLKDTHGIILYQEQVMQIARDLAGYTLGQADLLRRAMGKKKVEEMARHRDTFVEGAVRESSLSKQQATGIFDAMEKFAGYGFNKSHAAAYALLAYQIAWLKANHPAEFMAAEMSARRDNAERLETLIQECKACGVTVLPPDINRSEYFFTVDQDRVLYGLGAIKGVGRRAVEDLTQARGAGVPFSNLFDFCMKMDLRQLQRDGVDALVHAGAFDVLGEARNVLLAAAERAYRAGQQKAGDAASGMVDLFGEETLSPAGDDPYERFRNTVSDRKKELAEEKAALGLYLSGHPMALYRQEVQQLGCRPLRDLDHSSGIRVAGMVMKVSSPRNQMAVFVLEDEFTRIEATVFAEQYDDMHEKLKEGNIILVEGRVEKAERSLDGRRLRPKQLHTLDEFRQRCAQELCLHIRSENFSRDLVRDLAQLLKADTAPDARRSCPAAIRYCVDGLEASLHMAEEWQVVPDDSLLAQLRQCLGEDGVKIRYSTAAL